MAKLCSMANWLDISFLPLINHIAILLNLVYSSVSYRPSSSVKCCTMTERCRANNNRLTHFLHFSVGIIRAHSMCSVYYNFRYFKVRNFLNQTFYKLEDVFSFLVILFRNTISPKLESATVVFQLIIAL